MEISKTLYITNPKDWRSWLRKHYKSEIEIWLVYPKKATGKPRIEYNDAVEEALCFGWIDSINKRLDSDHTVQRFSPRKPKSKYSQANIERLRYLVANNKVIKEVAETLGDVLNEKFVIPHDILKAIKANKKSLETLSGFFRFVCSDSNRFYRWRTQASRRIQEAITSLHRDDREEQAFRIWRYRETLLIAGTRSQSWNQPALTIFARLYPCT